MPKAGKERMKKNTEIYKVCKSRGKNGEWIHRERNEKLKKKTFLAGRYVLKKGKGKKREKKEKKKGRRGMKIS